MNTATEIASAKRALYAARHPATPALYVPTVSGLWAHSHDPEHDLMKPWLVERALYTATGEPNGFNAIGSFNTQDEAEANCYTRMALTELPSGEHFTLYIRNQSGPWGDGPRLWTVDFYAA